MNKTGYKKVLDVGVGNIGYTLIRIAPIMAAIPAMLSLLRSADYSTYAWFMVGGVELTGYALGELTVRALQKGVITWKQALWPLGIYGLVIEGMLLGYDVIPAWANYYEGSLQLAEAIRSSVSILLPFFTLTGAGMLAIHDYIEQITADEEYKKGVSRQRDDISWQDDRAFKLAERDVKLSQKLSKAGLPPVVKVSQKLSTTGESIAGNFQGNFHESSGESFNESLGESIGKKIVRYLIDNPGAKQDDIAAHVDRSVPVVSKEIASLVETGVLHSEKKGTRKIVTVNGNHEAYLAN